MCLARSLRGVRFSLVTLFVKDPKATADWYVARLGLKFDEQDDRFVRLADDRGQPCVAFHIGAPVARPDHVQLHFEVDNVDASYESLQKAGVTFVEPPTDKPWGWRVATVTDPAGHTVELVTPKS